MPHTQPEIIKTLCYADIFDYPLTSGEVSYFLISKVPGVPQFPSRKKYHYLPGRQNLIVLRKKRAKVASYKRRLAIKMAGSLARIPTILGIFITGALSMNNTEADDDIDLMIITRKNTLWLTRLFITLYLTLARRRRYPNQKHAADKFCTNLYLDESALNVPEKSRNLYTAHEIAQAKPIFVRDNVDKRFLAANFWINKFLPNVPIPKNIPRILPSPFYLLLYPLERLAYQLQLAYMAKKRTRERTSPHVAFFHPRNTGQQVLKEYQERVSRYT